MAVTTSGAVAIAIICSLYFGFLITVAVLIIKNKMRFRRNMKGYNSSGYKALKSDIELANQSPPEAGDDGTQSNSVPQLPTSDDGGEDLEGKPKLEFGGNPVYQLDANGNERPHAPFELDDQNPETSRTRQLATSVATGITRS